ncbi:penicillin-binding protein 1B [Aliikangiella coralliicola]|uniref:Penicillin-binding protein 1B n=1 Tax=Aliikangiella coralliicola TaxID=2592383 RepID=A0A545UE01_9GAMM|nr:penicillin-binding protein 1B [Aliikangiella coralliicola]TQV87699.1 penicillin-binding protein 1B [Aliikangiella coralliicola]
MKLKLIWQRIKKTLLRLFLIGTVFFVFLVIYLDSLVKNEFNQQAWSIPAKVYARPLSFSVGKQISLKDLLLELNLLGYRKKIKATHQGEFEQYQNSLVIYTRPFKFWDGEQKAQVLEVTISNGQISELKDFATRKNVNFLRLDPLSLGSIQAGNNEDRVLVTLEQLPEHFLAALLNTEDRNFYEHWGISFKGIVRAAWSNFSQGELRQGGSTLTQQLMKNHFLTRERSLWRKLREAIMAVLMEIHYDKKVILEAYLNEVYLGQNNTTGIHGFARASEFYFDRPLEKLNLNQVALLVGMVKGPSLYNPRRNAENALERRNLVLSLMLDNGLITDEAYQDAVSRNLQVVAKPKKRTSKVPAFVGFIKRELRQEYSLSELNNQGLRLFTSLHPVVQQYAEKSLNKRLTQIESARDNKNKGLQGALIVSDIHTGDILAMVGDRNPNYVGFNRAIDAYRQTGSVIKPFVYLTALKQPESFSMITKLKDESFSLEGSDGSVWSPKNYDDEVHGEVELQDGLVNSYNIATARLALAVGVNEVVDTIVDAGFERELPAYPSIALGAKEMSPLEVLRIYQTLANNGVGVSSSGLIAVQDHQGNLLQRYRRTAQARLDPETAFMVKYLLTEVVKKGTAKLIGETFRNKRYAGKTGTTNDLRDSWYAGFGGDKLAVVWVGRDDNKPSELTGASGALRVWRDLFVKINEPSVDLNIPEELVWGYRAEGLFSGFGSCHSKVLVPFYLEQLPENFKVCE